MRLTFLFNPIFRVWTLHIPLLWTLFATGLLIFDRKALVGAFGYIIPLGFQKYILGCLGVIFIHNVLSVFRWQLKGSVFIDLITGFHIGTIATSPEPFFRQRLTFLGGCTPAHPPYTPARILLNRSIARPLVRGESRPILFARACIIWCIGLGVPIFAIYSIVFRPVTTQIYRPSPPGNASIFLTPLGAFDDIGNATYNIQGSIWPGTANHSNLNCETKSSISLYEWTVPGMPGTGTGILLQCTITTWPTHPSRVLIRPRSRAMVGRIQHVNISLLSTWFKWTGAMIGPKNGDLFADWLVRFGPTLDGVPLVAGSHLLGTFTWTQTNIESEGWSLLSPPTTPVYTPNVNGLQSYLGGETTDPSGATLTLVQRMPWATRQFVDTADATVLNGIATFGGFSTFLNGAFALFFGANVLYFAFGRLPLSALGLVHIFQCRRLKRQWNEDFPAIHTEGGLPGSESAGIVVFIREWLVDLEEDPHEHQADQPSDVEAQRALGADDIHETNTVEGPQVPKFKTHAHSTKTLERGYILDEIPLLDVDLGLGDMLNPVLDSQSSTS
ncbi:hypothetical protein C8F04DRAFT_1189476 [Mycena alexandri]|uniref:Uncharacterized protein n=1 Tax=Mycena alexandri TaxID=1745969 RepID=A0AAD6SH17_9AGAR|nr:hypothetical protein C8F04DRAFT_1189476 [Mycena alexandri]